jgi:hypothetical protein
MGAGDARRRSREECRWISGKGSNSEWRSGARQDRGRSALTGANLAKDGRGRKAGYQFRRQGEGDEPVGEQAEKR